MLESTNRRRAVIYLRTVPGANEEVDGALDEQHRECSSYAASQDYEVMGLFKDIVPLDAHEYPGWQAGQTFLHHTPIEVLLASRPDCLPSNVDGLSLMRDEAQEHGTQIVVVSLASPAEPPR